MAKLLAALGILALLSMALLVALRFRQPPKPAKAESFADRGVAQPLEALWPVPDFAFQDQHGRTVTAQSLKGKVWVADFIFTGCRTLCPLLTAKMVQLQRRLRGVDVSFVSFSVDPEHDTPEVLADYAGHWAPDEPRWQLLATRAPTLAALARGFRVTAEPAKPGELDPILHSAVFLLVDRDGVVRGVFDSEQRQDFEALQQGVRTLVGSPAGPGTSVEPEDGEGLYHALACANCHERPELAPALAGLAGQRRELDTGLTAIFDAAYVKESILSPDAQRLRGYPLHMPSYDGLLDEPRLDALTTWLLARPAVAGPGPGDRMAVDPICQMQVRVVADTPTAPGPSGPEYFCSARCRDRYLAAKPGASPAHP